MISDQRANFLLSVENLGYRRGNAWLFRSLSFQVRTGECVWLRGPNGAGKTSLLRLLVGLAQADEGRVVNANPNSLNSTAPVYVGHTNALKEDLTAMESLQFLLQLDDHAVDKVAALEAMRQFSIHQRCHQIVKTLSQGQRRRVALSRLALKKESALWVLDEPFEALDSQGMEVLYRLISEHTQRGGSVLLTSHIPVESSATPVRELHLTTLGSA